MGGKYGQGNLCRKGRESQPRKAVGAGHDRAGRIALGIQRDGHHAIARADDDGAAARCCGGMATGHRHADRPHRKGEDQKDCREGAQEPDHLLAIAWSTGMRKGAIARRENPGGLRCPSRAGDARHFRAVVFGSRQGAG